MEMFSACFILQILLIRYRSSFVKCEAVYKYKYSFKTNDSNHSNCHVFVLEFFFSDCLWRPRRNFLIPSSFTQPIIWFNSRSALYWSMSTMTLLRIPFKVCYAHYLLLTFISMESDDLESKWTIVITTIDGIGGFETALNHLKQSLIKKSVREWYRCLWYFGMLWSWSG